MGVSVSPIRIGFVPLLDSAPLVLAHELGLFREHGVNVRLVREPGWASIRDKIAYGELDAAHALAGLCFAISWGCGVTPRHCLTSYLFNAHGNAITLGKRWIDAGVRDVKGLAALRPFSKPLLFGIPHLCSSHHFLLRQWLRQGGLEPGNDANCVTLPPSHMTACLAQGHLDGYSVGEPFNTQAIQEGVGDVVVTSVELAPLHPEKALLVPSTLVEHRREEHRGLVLAIEAACRICDTPDGREQAASILTERRYLDVEEGLLKSSLNADRPEFHLFHGAEVNRPSLDKANWLVAQMRSAHLLQSNARLAPPVEEIFRLDLYDEILSREALV